MKNQQLIIISLLTIILLMLSGCFNDINTKNPDISRGLIAHYTFDEKNGTIAKDFSKYRVNGTVYGGKWTDGKIKGALDFDGINDYVQIPNNKSPTPKHLRNIKQGTISFWFKSDYIPTDNAIAPLFQYGKKTPCDVKNNANGGLIIELGHDPLHNQSKKIYFTFFSNGCKLYPSLCFDSNKNLRENKWYHFVVVVGYHNNIGYNTGYLNGQKMIDRHYNFANSFTAEFFKDATMHESLTLGKGFWNREIFYFDGKIDDLRIYNRPLSSEEVVKLYNFE
ncbi:MAG: LamG domain-containing protein [Candidatus Thermoplasmatota archaeon]